MFFFCPVKLFYYCYFFFCTQALSEEMRNFLRQCLTLDAEERPLPRNLLSHPLFQPFIISASLVPILPHFPVIDPSLCLVDFAQYKVWDFFLCGCVCECKWDEFKCRCWYGVSFVDKIKVLTYMNCLIFLEIMKMDIIKYLLRSSCCICIYSTICFYEVFMIYIIAHLIICTCFFLLIF